MTQQQPPPWGSLPAAPPTRSGELAPSRAGDVAVAWVLWTLLLLVCIAVWLVMLVAGFAVGLGCSSDSTADAVCSGAAADVAQTGYFLMWVVMGLAVVGTLVMTIVQTSRRRLAWIWPAIGFGVVIGSFLLWWLVYEIVA